MKSFGKSLAVLASAAAFCLVLAGAQAQQSTPQGSYAKTCNNVSVSGTTLNATCMTFNQQPSQTSLPFYSSCVGDIGNVNGTLACAGPNGSYALTCRNSVVQGDVLSAECQKINGQWVPSKLTGFQGFQGNISNCDGQLKNGNC